ncbi:unnamed protein product [Chilo suppressalis]|uniref:Phorbol-ester/DAG-type domain-containing protein n=1 Tax=Chilo suppressalis TaxID=168631 RepID=A0ABN8B4A3_CHISP|nr:unnamed protein product [Chilo suppressalis]
MASGKLLYCAGCHSIVDGAKFMTCIKCKQIFDILCANYSENIYASLSLEFKKS